MLRQVLSPLTNSSNIAVITLVVPSKLEPPTSPSLPPLDRIRSCSIVSLLFVFVALRKWDSATSSFLVPSNPPICYSRSMDRDHVLDPGAVFFVEWPTWARLCVVLGVLLVILVVMAICVRVRNWRKNLMLERKATEAEAERAEISLSARKSHDIPFGIRALLEDPEVEGVWNSRTNTPLRCYSPRKHGSVASLHPCNPPKYTPSSSSNAQPRTEESELVSPNERQPLRDPITKVDGGSDSRSKSKKFVINHQGPYLRSDLAREPDRDSNTTRPRLDNSPSKMYLRPTANQSSNSGRKFVIGNRHKDLPRHPGREAVSEANALERMEAHRRFHAAESGQLLPRSRRRNTDLALMSPLASSASDSDDGDSVDIVSSQVRAWQRGTAEMNLGKQLSRRVERMEGPKAVPFRAFVESLPTSKPPPSAWTNKTQARLDAKLPPSSKGSETASQSSKHTPNSSISSTCTSPTSQTSSVSIVNTRTRKVNSGFEVLPAGTLEKGPDVKEFGLWPENPRVTISKKPRKLQKRRSQSNSSSRRSSVESARTSNESFRFPVF
ncbi:uncharacterized protein PV06_02104 [Exophiala oligosperma]|uniref:Uncharacterized protein n=1 Tax=Exophiala oligosperma TaxID=215243 RepID=A0A0D2C9E2_9EURO|nr:uncharacterized protein PV06_02104 [Exophiala oligosperma]KIW46432.1 hypothetical protein PV06_02104 [Exophiala oligosperma]